MLKLRQAVPPLGVTTLDGRSWKLTDLRPDSFTMVVFYRGLHSPQCQRYVEGLADQVGAFERGVEVIAISTDERDRAEQVRTSGRWIAFRSAMGCRSTGRGRGACTSPTRAA